VSGTTYKRCEHGTTCPDLDKRRHGSWFYATRITTTTGRQLLRRGGFPLQREAEAALKHVNELIALARGDAQALAQVGDMIIERTKRGGALPDAGLVARRLGLNLAPDGPGITCAEAWSAWLAGKRKLRESSRRRLEQLGEHWILPVIGPVALERLNGQHCADVFGRIDRINAEIIAQRADGRALIKVEGDVRQVPRVIGVASMHRVYAALQAFCNFEVRKTRRLAFNPVYVVELDPEQTPEAEHWTAAQARRFMARAAADPLGLMFRIAVLRGGRRGELCGFRWSDSDLDAGYLAVERPLLQLGGRIVEGRPKTRDSERKVWLDDATLALLREHRKAQLAARLRAGSAWLDNDLVFCREDGSPWPPDYVSRRFKAIAKDAGVPVIKLHEGGRHTGASLARTAEVDPEIRRKTLGHADAKMTSHYTHIEAEAHRQAAEAVAALVEGAGQ
jgi:integrase